MMTKTTVHAALLTLFAAAALTSSAEVRITRIEISRIESPTFEGGSFGTVGPYEKLVGRAYGEIDPTDRRNAVIVDVGLAPRNARGLVEYDTDIFWSAYGKHPADGRLGSNPIEGKYEPNVRSFGTGGRAGGQLESPVTAISFDDLDPRRWSQKRVQAS
jgi:hypothetical protein